jgi:hypothetical protein
MRQISAAALDKLNTQYGVEPIFVLGVKWVDNYISYYAGKTINDPENNIFIPGQIIEINNVESILNLDGNQNSVSIDVTLDDQNGELLSLMDNVDIHKRTCYLYQYFDGIALGDMFLLFEGQIVSEISWSDADKTLKFAIVTMFDNYEAGFSPEEGDVLRLREDLVGKAWPMGFGTVIKYPASRITDIPTGVTTEPMGIHDHWLDSQVTRTQQLHDSLMDIAQFYFKAALQALNTGTPEALQAAQENEDAGNAALIAADEAMAKHQDFLAILNEQLSYDKQNTYVLTDYPIDLPPAGSSPATEFVVNQNVRVPVPNDYGVFEVGGNYLVGKMQKAGNGLSYFSFQSVYHAFVESYGQLMLDGPITRGVNDFVYIQAGSNVRYLGSYPVKYVVNIIPSDIIHVYANRTFEGSTRRMKVPPAYYKKITVRAQSSLVVNGPIFAATGIQLHRPLSTYFNEHWDDEIFVTFKSSIGSDFQSILTYIVRTFTIYDVDTDSLATIPAFNLNFAITDLKDVLTMIREICYQCKVGVTLKSGKFYFVYLPKLTTPVMTITITDLIEGSLTFSFTPTENLITKMVGTWKIDHSDPKDNRIVIRYNVPKYGTLTQEQSFYVFNVAKAVEATMSFWLYRKGNSWKRLKFQVPIKFLPLETFDIITLQSNFTSEYGIASGANINAVVQNVTYNANDNVVDIELELPIKLGKTP